MSLLSCTLSLLYIRHSRIFICKDINLADSLPAEARVERGDWAVLDTGSSVQLAVVVVRVSVRSAHLQKHVCKIGKCKTFAHVST